MSLSQHFTRRLVLACPTLLVLGACPAGTQERAQPDAGLPMAGRSNPEDMQPSERDAGGRIDSGTPTQTLQAAVGPDGAAVELPGGELRIEVPPGALPREVMLTIEPSPDAPDGGVGTAYDLGPDGTVFASPVLLALPYAPSQSVDPSQLALATVVDGHWEILAHSYVDSGAGLIYGTTLHFSTFGVIRTSQLCGDGVCNGEACHCPGDCGGVTATGCGDGICCGDEDCGSCPTDCDECCGNGYIDDGRSEECDGEQLRGKTCVSLGYLSGALRCASGCVFDTTACDSGDNAEGLCGNGQLDPGEACDPEAGPTPTCAMLGFDSGDTSCQSCQIDSSDCSDDCEDVRGYYHITGTAPGNAEIDEIIPVQQSGCQIGFPVPVSGAVSGELRGTNVEDAGNCDLTRTADRACCDATFGSDSISMSCVYHLNYCDDDYPCYGGLICSTNTCQQTRTYSGSKVASCAADDDCDALEQCDGYCQPCTAPCTPDASCTPGGEGGTGVCEAYANGCSRCRRVQ